MINTLSKKDQRLIRILDYLVDHRTTSLQKLSKGSRVPDRTLWEDIRRINELCAPAEIVAAHSGIELYIPSEYNERHLFESIMKESTELTILEDIFLHMAWSVAGLAEKFYLSEATIRRTIQHINKTLEKRGIYISTNPLEIRGDTKTIEQMFILFFSEKYNRINLFMNQNQIDSVDFLFHNIKAAQHFIQNNQVMNQMILQFYVRICIYKSIPQDIIEKEEIKHISNLDTVNEKLHSAFGIELSASLVQQCLPDLFNSIYLAKGEKTLSDETIEASDMELFNQVVRFLNTFVEMTGIEFSKRNELTVIIFHYLKTTINIPFIIYNRNQHFITLLSIYSPHLVKQVKKMFLSFFPDKKYANSCLTVLYYFFTYWKGIITFFKSKRNGIDVAIFFDSDLNHALFTKEILEQEFGELIRFHVLDARTYEEITNTTRKFDILITNKPGIISNSFETICLAEFFSKEAWEDLRKKLIHVENQSLPEF